MKQTRPLLTILLFWTVALGCARPAPTQDAQTPAADAGTQAERADATGTARRLQAVDVGDIGRAHVFDDIYMTSQPGEADFQTIRSLGITTVINQRKEGENTDFNEREIVTGLGMTYQPLAFNGVDELTDDVLDQTRAAFRETPRPMLIHCASANRTGATWLAYAALDRGLSWEQALAEARTVGLRSEQYMQRVREYIAARRGNGP